MLNGICLNGPKDKSHRQIKAEVVVEEGDAVTIVAAEEVEIEEAIKDRIVAVNMIQDLNMDRRIQIYKAENIIIQEMFKNNLFQNSENRFLK